MDQEKLASFTGSLGTYHWLKTEDGSQTLHSDYFDEACHSMAGGRLETLHNYIDGCAIAEKAKLHSPLIILEIGLGTGLGLSLTLESMANSQKVHYISCELDHKLVLHTLNKLSATNLNYLNPNYLTCTIDHHQVTILIGDVREQLPKVLELLPSCHAIYQDAFSPKRNPNLWTRQWFELLKVVAAPDCILATYSSTKGVWKAMMEAGWCVQEIEGFGKKRLSTVAKLQGVTSQAIIEMLGDTPALTDEQL
jgi:tRNA U34 5-methylaminomethyl-2-thiouridine-forming methyltransferase MnmC